VVHLFQLEYSDRNLPFHFWQTGSLIREFGKGIKNGKSHSYWLTRFNRKMLFHFPWVLPLISDWSVWHNESTQYQLIISKADRLPLKTEPVARNKNTILVLKNKLGQKRYIMLLSVKKSVKVYPLFACKLLNYWPSFILHALWPFLLGRKRFFFIMLPDPIVLPFHIFLNLT